MPDEKYTGPSALDEILKRTDPRVGEVYRQNGFPDLPRYVSQLGGAAVESATLGVLKPPQDAQTTPEHLIRGVGHLLGASFVPLGPVVKGAAAFGISKTLTGAAANIAATEVQTRGQASLSRLVLDGAFGALFGKLYPTAATPLRRGGAATLKAGDVVAREEGVPSPISGTIDLAKGRRATYNQLARFHPDPEVRQLAKRIVRFHDTVQPGEINTGELSRVWNEGQGTVPPSPHPAAIEHTPEHLIQEAQVPLHQVETGIGPLTGIRPVEGAMQGVETRSQGRIKAFSEIFDPLVRGRMAAQNEAASTGREISRALSGVSKKKYPAMLEYLKTPEAQRPLAARSLGLTASDTDRALRVRDQLASQWERNFGDFISFDNYMTDLMPRLTKLSPQEVEEMRSSNKAGTLLRYAADSELRFDSKSIDRFAGSHARMLAMVHHFDPEYRRVQGLAMQNNYPPEFRNYLGNVLNQVRGTQSSFVRAFQGPYKRMLGSIGIDAKDSDVRDVISVYSQLTSAGLLGFRPASFIKVISHAFQTGPRIGLEWVWRGVRKAATREGWDAARRAGMIEDEVMHDVTEMNVLHPGGAVRRGVTSVASKAMGGIRLGDAFNRVAMFNGMRDRFLAAAKNARSEEQVLSRSGLYRFHPIVRDQVLAKWRANDVEGAARLAGEHAVHNTVWMYRTEFRPTAMSGEINRALLKFGIWPMNYLEYMRQMVTLPMPGVEKAKWAGEWVLGQAALLGLFGAAGSAVGLGPDAIKHTLSWANPASAVSYAGGPLLDLLRSLRGWSPEAPTQAANEARRQAKDFALTMVPGADIARDVARAKGTGAETMEQIFGQDLMKQAGMEYKTTLPSQSTPEELFRIMTAVRRTQP